MHKRSTFRGDDNTGSIKNGVFSLHRTEIQINNITPKGKM